MHTTRASVPAASFQAGAARYDLTGNRIMVQPTIAPSPADTLDSADRGDETQRNFRYQHAYGVILLIGSASGGLPYVSIWCEHHEDFLAELPDGRFDGYQIETATPENGPWKWTDDPLRDSIKRFVQLDKRFPGKINTFSFVSNVECLNSHAKEKLVFSPFRLWETIKTVASAAELTIEQKRAFDKLCGHCACPPDDLLAVLRRLKFVKGPGRDSFDSELAHDHLPAIAECHGFSPATLNRLRDHLVQLVSNASSLANTDPSRHWCCVNGEDHKNAALRGKRISVAQFSERLAEFRSCPFRFASGTSPVALGSGKQQLSVLQQKMIRGGLEDQFQTMRDRSISAEAHLMELAHLVPDQIDTILDQVVGLVAGECDEARLSASQAGEPYGRRMLSDVFTRLRETAQTRAEMVHRQQYECLVGVAGLLTGECRVWWSPPFELTEGK
jgi:hypothetical protein